ncbi:MAG: DUF3667 domain-containing protein [Muribaculaceae bacterium]|nr:DUF3667 domain-containing protein [Muribaculaceae bacterium]
MDIKAAYKRFRQWQLDPFKYDASSQELHQCNNCGNDFTGNYRPVCSQKENVGPITWKSVAQSIAEVWGLHNRSLTFSVVQLFLRPGYFISDYINGKRQVSFPPVKMLAIVSLLGIFVDVMVGAKDIVGVFDSDFDFEGDKMIYLDNAFEWMNAYPDLMSMIMLSYLIIPNYFIFRFAPRNAHHTLPQGFFVQIFCSVIFLVLNMMYDITRMGSFVFVLGAVVLYATYKQLFGYGVWGTLWRLVAAMTAAIVLAMIMLWLDYCIHLFDVGILDKAKDVILFELLTVVAFVTILWSSYWISKPRPPKPESEPDNLESETIETPSPE